MTSKTSKRGRDASDKALLTTAFVPLNSDDWLGPRPPAPPLPPAVEPAVDRLIGLLEEAMRAIIKLALPVDGPAPLLVGQGPGRQVHLDPANFDWDPTDADPDLRDGVFGAIVPDRPQVGDAPDLETNPFGVPGLSWPPKPGDVVS